MEKEKKFFLKKLYNNDFYFRFMENPDFYEGVRCTLVDKKATPNWRYKSPFDVPQEEIDRYFSKLPENLELHF